MKLRFLKSINRDWAVSAGIHLSVVLIAVISIYGSRMQKKSKPNVKFEIKEVFKEPPKPEIKLSAQPPPKPVTVQKRVFGINNKTLTSEKKGAVQVKAGNTIAKEIDKEIIDPNQADPLPIPTEDYLISQMPRLKQEIKIPYPPEARKKNIEGTVVLEILIDDTGKVREAKLIDGPGYGLNEAALQAIYSFSFTPASMNGSPVAVRIRYGYKFILN